MADPTPQLQDWLKGFPREEAEVRIRDLERELEGLRQALALHDAFIAPTNGGPPEKYDGVEPPNRPEAIRTVLRRSGNQPMLPGEIKDAMIEHGWLTDDQRHLKRFYSTMSTMTTRNHLLRLHDGRYTLPQDALKGGGMS